MDRHPGQAQTAEGGCPRATGGGFEGFSVGALISTKMAGPEPAMNAESAYFGLLQQARSYKVDDSGLTLMYQNGNELLTYTSAGQG